MDLGHDKIRMNIEGDRLSNLPIDLIHKILSIIDIREAIGTSVLSSRWRFIWTSMPYLNFSTVNFCTLPSFSKFVTNVLSHRNNSAEVYSLNLRCRVKSNHVLVKRVLNYAFSHNIQQLNVVYLLENDTEFPLSLFSSQSLKYLSLTTRSASMSVYNTCFTSTWELPTLTTLVLHSVTLQDANADKGISVFSKCPNLTNLTLNQFKTIGSDDFSIFHPRLLNLTLENCCTYKMVFNVVAPQLENLTIRSRNATSQHYIISAPDLISLLYKSSYYVRLSTEGFHSLKKADICVSLPCDADAHNIYCLLQLLHSVNFLKLNLEIVEILSTYGDLILEQTSPFVNLKSLTVYPEIVSHWEYTPRKVAMSPELKSYLLDGSPGSIFTMVLREEIMAPKLLPELGALLETVKEDIKITREYWKAQVNIHAPKAKMTRKFGGYMAQIKSGWENLGVNLQQRKEKACFIISNLQRIEELLSKLPASKRAKFQPCFSSLCIEAESVISQVTDCMQIQCDENQSRSSVCLYELATSSEPYF